MPRIERLPEDLVNKIAAGEVVERPASVVKELLENALDAGAVTVHVEIEGGGRSLIRVRDDGCGMDREDAQRALERHATSKVRGLEDLQTIATHGFRGEALPSIASVSHLLLRTRDESGPAGTEVEMRHGRMVHVRDAGHPRGTTVEVRDLFGEVPARRKFLRANATEAGHVAEAVTLLALARPDTGFLLLSEGRRVLQAPPVEGLAARTYQVFGTSFLEDLLPVEGGAEWVRVRGYVSRPDRPGPSRPSLRLFVNGRAIRDRLVAKAVSEACRAAGAGDRPYEAILFLEAPLDLVDVNVHPAKAEVRFADSRTVWTAVGGAVRDALGAGARARAPRADASRVERAVESFLGGAGGVAEGAAAPSGGTGPQILVDAEGPPPPQASFKAPPPPTVLGQHRQTYIVATDGEELILVDQHTAHERICFEALLDRVGKRAAESQLLLSPPVFTLPPALRPVLEANGEALRDLGYDVEGFGADAFLLRAVPALLRGGDPGAALTGILRDLLEREATQWAVSDLRDRLAATVACHAAVRAGQKLLPETMRTIVRDLLAAAHPTLCPHGRPTIVRIPREDVAHWFGRTGWRRQ